MNKIKTLIGAVIILAGSAFTTYTVINWKVKEDYSVRVYQGGSQFVSFSELKAAISFDEQNPERSKISATINANSIGLVVKNDALKDAAKKPDALDVEKYPLISFESTRIIKKDTAACGTLRTVLFLPGEPKQFKYEATGKLALKGITKEIKIPFTFENEVFKGGFSIDPKDFNITSVAFQKNLDIVLYTPVTK